MNFSDLKNKDFPRTMNRLKISFQRGFFEKFIQKKIPREAGFS
jgi:hypothetical protein